MDRHKKVTRTSFFRFYEELNDFLPKEKQKISFPYNFTGNPSIKDTFEAIGIPHTEVDLLLINGKSVDFKFILKGGEYISVYPVFESFDISEVNHLRPEPLRKIKFICDVHLGKLVVKLRLLGFDTLYSNDFKDHEIIDLSLKGKRTILTRDIGILKHQNVTHGYWIRNDDPKDQIKEVVDRFHLDKKFKPFTRCSMCNGSLRCVQKESIKDMLEFNTYESFDLFMQCEKCEQIYWKGAHYEKITQWIKELEILDNEC